MADQPSPRRGFQFRLRRRKPAAELDTATIAERRRRIRRALRVILWMSAVDLMAALVALLVFPVIGFR